MLGNQSYWPSRGVLNVKTTDVATLWEAITFGVPFHELDRRLFAKMKEAGVRYGGNIVFRRPTLFVLDPELLKNILVKDFDHFINRRVFEMGKGDPVFDNMLFNLENQEWKDLRNTMTPTFTTGKIRKMFGIFQQSGDKMTEFIKQECEKADVKGEIELRDVCGRYTMDVVAAAAFGVESHNFENKDSTFAVMGRRMQDRLSGFVLFQFIVLFLFPKLFKILKFSFFDKSVVGFFNQVLNKSIEHREKTGEKRQDFLQLMLDAKAGHLKAENDENEEDFLLQGDVKEWKEAKSNKKTILTNDVILAQSNVFFLAGFDVTETLLMFACYELSLHPEIQERLYQEIKDAVEKNNGKMDYDLVNRMEYLEMVISGKQSQMKINSLTFKI